MAKKNILLGLFLISCVLFVMGLVWVQEQKKEFITIGAIISLSGPQGPTIEGTGVQNGMLLAVDGINRFGGVNGKKIELIIEDAQINPQKAKELFKIIEARDHPLFYISTHSSVSAALAPLAEEHEVALMATVATDPRITEGNPWVYRYWPTAVEELPVITALLEDLKVQEIGMLYVNDEFGQSVFRQMEKEAEDMSWGFKGEAFGVTTSDFKEHIARIFSSEALFLVGFPSQLEIILRQLKEEGFSGILISTNAAAGPSIQKLPESEGLYVTAPLIYNQNLLSAKAVREKYEQRFHEPFNHYAAAGYDLIQLIRALLEDEEFSRDRVRMVLEQGFVHPGVFGTNDVRPGDHDIGFPLSLGQIIGGQIRYRYK